MQKPIIQAEKIIKTFHNGVGDITVLRGVDFLVSSGQFVSIMGRSGAGKSTLMYQLGLLDHPTSGNIILDGVDTALLQGEDRTRFRLEYLGYVFQDYAILPELTAEENVVVPLLMQGFSSNKAVQMAMDALEKVGLGPYANKTPGRLSGGEQQRVSIARAIAHNPKIIFADEPTANLDSETSKKVIDIFKELNSQGQTIVMVTHEMEYGECTDRIVTLNDGIIISDKNIKN